MNHNDPFVGASMRPAVPEAMGCTCMQRISVRCRGTVCLECVRFGPELDCDRASMGFDLSSESIPKTSTLGLPVKPSTPQDHVPSIILGLQPSRQLPLVREELAGAR